MAHGVDHKHIAPIAAERYRALIAQPGARARALGGCAQLQHQAAFGLGRKYQQLIAGRRIGAGEHVSRAKTVAVVVVGSIVVCLRNPCAAHASKGHSEAQQFERAAS